MFWTDLYTWLTDLPRFVRDDFFRGFCRHVPLPAALVGTLLLVRGIAGGLGVPVLVWHEKPLLAVANGFALTLLCLFVLQCGYLLHLRDWHDQRDGRVGALYPAGAFHATILVCVAGVVVLLMSFSWALTGVDGLIYRTTTPVRLAHKVEEDGSVSGEARAVSLMALGGLAGLGAFLALARLTARAKGYRWFDDWKPGPVYPRRPLLWAAAALFLGGVAYVAGTAALHHVSWQMSGPVLLLAWVVAAVAALVLVTALAWLAPAHEVCSRKAPFAYDVWGAVCPEADRLVALWLGLGAVLLALTEGAGLGTPIIYLVLVVSFAIGVYALLQCLVSRLVWPLILILLVMLIRVGGVIHHPYRIPFEAGPDPYSPGGLVQLPAGLCQNDLERWRHTLTSGEPGTRVRPEPTPPPDDKTSRKEVWLAAKAEDECEGITLSTTFDFESFLKPCGRKGGGPRYAQGQPRPLVLIAVSGGGSKAALWTLAILHRLEKELAAEGVDLADHVRVITGASGGMLGASVYAAGLLEPGDAERRRAFCSEKHLAAREEDRKRIAEDFLTPLARELLLRDLPAAFSPWPRAWDRGRQLEEEWKARFPRLKKSFADLAAAEREGRCPSLIFSPMLVEDGRRLLISNLDLRHLASNDANRLYTLTSGEPDDGPVPRDLSHSALELFRILPGAEKKLTLATATRLSASFPYFTPGTHLPSWPPRRIVDAGYYDNYGVSLASAWLLSGTNRSWLGPPIWRPSGDAKPVPSQASGVLLIQIRAANSESDRRLKAVERDRTHPLIRGSHQFTTPLAGLASMRESSMSFRNDEMLEAVSHLYDILSNTAGAPASRFFAIATFELELAPGEEVELSWRLTEYEKAKLSYCAGLKDAPPDFELLPEPNAAQKTSAYSVLKKVNGSIDHIKKWWADHPGAKP